MVATLEREIKLGFRDPEQARQAVLAAGATPLRGRRLQEDYLLDTHDDQLRQRRCVLRVRVECGKTLLTFKGPVQSSPMKLREELETIVGDGLLLMSVLEQLGLRVWFRYEKYREEFAREDVTIAIDETPVGTFVEIEGSEHGIRQMADALARQPADYVTDSYRCLYVKHCERNGLPLTHMLFEES
jgi:adenylate cyclase class 2